MSLQNKGIVNLDILSCVVKDCTKTSMSHPRIAFMEMPKEPESRQKWLQSFDRNDLIPTDHSQLYTVCESHYYMNLETTQSQYSFDHCDKFNNTAVSTQNLPDTEQKAVHAPTVQPSTSKASDQVIKHEELDGILQEEGELDDYTVTVKIDPDSEDENDILHDDVSNTATPEFSPVISNVIGSQDTSRGKLLIPIPATPYEMFELFINDDFMAIVADETNKYAQAEEEKSGKEYWIDTNAQELKVFIGLLLHTGTFKFHRVSDYWASDETALFSTQFENYMPQHRFQELLHNLSFTSDRDSGRNDSFWKVRPIIDHFNNVMKTSYHPDEVAIAEETTWQEREHQFYLQVVGANSEPTKPHSLLYLLREPTGIIIKLNLHQHEGKCESEYSESIDDIIFKLVKGYLHLYSAMYLRRSSDKSFSCEVAMRLPPNEASYTEIVSETTTTRGNEVAKFCKAAFTDIIKAWDLNTKMVLYFILTPEKISRMPKEPYSKMNYHDVYKPLQKAILPYHRKFFIHFLLLSLINSHSIFRKYSKKLDFFDFRMEIIASLLPSSSYEVQRKGRKLPIPHHLDPFPKKQKQVACVVCSAKRELPNVTDHFCRECPMRPALCVECFCDIHC